MNPVAVMFPWFAALVIVLSESVPAMPPTLYSPSTLSWL